MKEFDIRKYMGADPEHKIINEHCGHCPEDLQDEEPVVEDEALTEATPYHEHYLKAIYKIANECEQLVNGIKKEAGRRPVPKGSQYGDFKEISRVARELQIKAKSIKLLADTGEA